MRGFAITVALCAAASAVMVGYRFLTNKKQEDDLDHAESTPSIQDEVASARPSSALLQLRALPSHFSTLVQQAGVQHVSTIAGSCEFRAFTNAEQQADTCAVPGLLLLAQLPPLDLPSQALPTPDEDGSYLRFLQSLHAAQEAQAAEQADARLLRLIEVLREKDAPTSSEQQSEGAPVSTTCYCGSKFGNLAGAVNPVLAHNLPQAETEDTVFVHGVEYTIVRRLGVGASSQVFEVEDPHGRTLAVKRIAVAGANGTTAAGYLGELALLKRLEHAPHVIKLIDSQVLRIQGLIYIVLESGRMNLRSMLRRRDAVRRAALGGTAAPGGLLTHIADEDLTRIRSCWQHMLKAVCACHEQRIVHRDLKPANFVLVDGDIKLIDFGIAKTISKDGDSVEGGVAGTVPYMAPEAIEGGLVNSLGVACVKLGRPSDVWSLGCILYEITYGRNPFAHVGTNDDMMAAICNPQHQVKFPQLANKQLIHVMKRCLDRNPRTRITVQELLVHPFLHPEAANTASAGGLSSPYRPF